MTAPFSVRESFKTGWRLLRSHSGLVFGVVLTLFAVQIAQSIVDNTFKDGEPTGVAAGIVLGILSAVLGIGATVITLRLAEHKHAEYKDIIPTWSVFWRTIGSGILVALIVGVPILIGVILVMFTFFALVAEPFNFSEAVAGMGDIPAGALVLSVVFALLAIGTAVYLGLRYSLARFTVIDGAKVVDSLRKSWHMTGRAMGKLFLFVLAALGLNILGAIPFGLGLLVTMPLTMLAFAHIYTKLKGHHTA